MFDRHTDLNGELAVGACPTRPEHVDQLAHVLGVRGVVNLQSDDDMAAKAIHWPLLWQAYTAAGIQVTRVPMIDFDKRSLARHLEDAVAAVEAHVSAGRKVYVHCQAGLNRSPTTIAAWLVAHRDMTPADAVAWISERHTCVPYGDVVARWWKKRR